ncbi:MAG TPA: hypothetical protein VEW28_07445 [Candidatus Kapabacteria bacterium]|nr:hypothetical protein [Candidatus Kapabacteria bacterium]
MMNKYISTCRMLLTAAVIAVVAASQCSAQTGVLRGGSVILKDGSNTITLKLPGSFTSGDYSLTLAPTQSSASATQWISNNGTGVLGWSSTPGGLVGNAVNFVPGVTQATATSGRYLMDLISQNTSSNTSSPGAFIASSVVDQSNSSATGLTITAANTLASATGVNITGACLSAYSLAQGTSANGFHTGLEVGVTGGGNNYAALFQSGNVGIGTSTPSESLVVNGNIRISGQKGLKITEGSNATMGIATLGVGGTVNVNTTKVTANSRIFLMDQAPNAGTPGTCYISARTASTSFTITSTNNGDRSDVAWWIVEP